MAKMSPSMKARMKDYYARQLRILEKPDRAEPPKKTSEARRRVWTHNSFFGHCKMAEKNMLAMIAATSTTPEAKDQANRIILELQQLHNLLQKRVDS